MKVYNRLAEIDGRPTFLVQQECIDRRIYIEYSSASEYYASMLPNCHEVFMDPFIGRPAFDFDFKSSPFTGWEKVVEETLSTIFRKEFNITDLKFVWMMTDYGTSKISKHLVIKNVEIINWSNIMKLRIIPLLNANAEMADRGIYRKCGSLRLPLNAKLGGVVKKFVSDECFFSGLVGVYDENEHEIEHTISDKVEVAIPTFEHVDMDVDMVIQRLDRLGFLSIYEIGDISDNFIRLKRVSEGECPVSGHHHDRENAYVKVVDGKVLFGCFRAQCTKYGSTAKMIML